MDKMLCFLVYAMTTRCRKDDVNLVKSVIGCNWLKQFQHLHIFFGRQINTLMSLKQLWNSFRVVFCFLFQFYF